MHIRLFERPSPVGGTLQGALEVVGSLPVARVAQSYTGRLDIVNAIGACTVEMLDGSLPPGATVYVDNDTHQVVVTWPSYQSGDTPIANASLEAGNADGWQLGPGWSVTDDNATDGDYTLVYANNGGDSRAVSTTRAEVSPGTSVHASCDVRQGASSSGNAGACVLLEFRDASGLLLSTFEGNLVDQGSNNESQVSSVVASAPTGTATVNIGTRGFRKRQNREVWVDNFSWNVQREEVGVNITGSYCITLRVHDSAGRQADWEGCVEVAGTGTKWWGTKGTSVLYSTDDPVNGPWVAHEMGFTVASLVPLDQQRMIVTGGGRLLDLSSGVPVVVSTGHVVPSPASLKYVTFWPATAGKPEIILYHNGSGQVAYSTDLGLTFETKARPLADDSDSPPVRLSSGRWVRGAWQGGPRNWVGSYSDAIVPDTADWIAGTPGFGDSLQSTGPLLLLEDEVWGISYAPTASPARRVAMSSNGATWTSELATDVFTEGAITNLGSDSRCIMHWNGSVAVLSEGQNGVLHTTTDNGGSWRHRSLGGSLTPILIAEAEGTIMVNLQNALPRYSTDGGDTWDLLPNPLELTVIVPTALGDESAPGGVWN